MRTSRSLVTLLAPAMLLVPALLTTPAEAGIGACGDIEVSADANCELLTFPVSIGRMDWQTPLGETRVTRKVKDPSWIPPDSIREEAALEGRELPRVVPPGPDNPMGEYALHLGLPGYRIHGTNRPSGVGMRVTHGCVRMYPEDIDRLYPKTPVGTKGEFVYETIKIGEMNGRVYVEVHEDIYGQQPGRWRHAVSELEEKGLLGLVDEAKLHEAISEMRGIPVDVSRDDVHLVDPRPGSFHPQVLNEIDTDDTYPRRETVAGG